MWQQVLLPILGLLLSTSYILWATVLLLFAVPVAICYKLSNRQPSEAIGQFAAFFWTSIIWFFLKWGRFQVLITTERQKQLDFFSTDIPVKENVIFTSNHVWAFDWLFIFAMAKNYGRLQDCKYLVKKSALYIPTVGLGLYLTGSMFLSRCWQKDKKTLEKKCHWLTENKLPFWLILHPEGTRFAPQKLKQSNAYMQQQGDDYRFTNVLSPRSKGLAFCRKELHVNVYDITLLYHCKAVDGSCRHTPTIGDVIFRRGGFCHIYVKKCDSLSKNKNLTENAVASALLHLWKEKDHYLSQHLHACKKEK